ncbi:hypothetical protein, partial [Umezawaea endophytica]
MAAIAAPTRRREIRFHVLFILTSSGSMEELSRTHTGIVNCFRPTNSTGGGRGNGVPVGRRWTTAAR